MVMVAMMVAVSGCNATSAERVAMLEGMLGTINAQSEQIQQIVDGLEEAAAKAELVIDSPLVPEDKRESARQKLLWAREQLTRYRPLLADLQEAMVTVEAEIAKAETGAGFGLGQELQLYGRGISVGAPALPASFNGIAALLGLGLSLVGGIVGSIAQKKKDAGQLAARQQANDQAVRGIVQSVDALLGSTAVVSSDRAKQVLKDHQIQHSPEARAAVRRAMGAAA